MKLKYIFVFVLILSPVCWASPAFVTPATKHFIKAALLEEKGDYKKSLKEYEKAAKLDANDPFIYQQLSKTALRLGLKKEGLEFAEKAVKLSPGMWEAYLTLANAQIANGKEKEAVENYKKSLGLNSENPQALMQLGFLTHQTDRETSKNYFRQVLAIAGPNKSPAYFSLGVLYADEKNYKTAVEYFDKALKDNPSFAQASVSKAGALEQMDNLDGAIETLKQAVNEGAQGLLIEIAKLYQLKGDLDGALEYVKKTKSAFPRHPQANFYLVNYYERKQEYDKAVDCARQSADYGKNPELSIKLAYFLSRLGDKDGAFKELQTAYSIWPNNQTISYLYGLRLGDDEKYKESFEVLEKLSEKYPNDPQTLYTLGISAERAGYIEQARTAFEKYLSIEPKNDMILNYLGYMLADRNLDPDAAEKYVLRAIELSADNSAYLDSLAWVYYRKSDYKKAREYMEKSLKIRQDDSEVWLHYGYINFALGDMEGAWFGFKVAKLFGLQTPDTLAKTKKAEEKLAKEEKTLAYKKYFETMFAGLKEFSALCKIKFRGSKEQLSGVFKYDGKGIKITFIDAFLAPAGDISLTADGKFDVSDKLNLPDGFDDYIKNVLVLAQDYYTGKIYDGAPLDLSLNKLTAGNYQIKFGGDKTAPYSVKNETGELRFENYKAYLARQTPLKIKFKLNKVRAEIEFSSPKILPKERIF